MYHLYAGSYEKDLSTFVRAVKWLEQRSRNIEVPSSNPPVAIFFFCQQQSVLNQVPQERGIFDACPISYNNLSRVARGEHNQNEDKKYF